MKTIANTLIVVDMQYDFLSGGALSVPGADMELAKRIDRLAKLFDHVLVTADDHPVDHVSFSTFPPHCIHDTHGAALAVSCASSILYKGKNRDSEEFSAFAQGRRLNMIEGKDVYVCGVAGEYCVKATIEDVVRFAPEKRVFAIVDLIKSVDGSSYIEHDPFEGKVRFVTSDQVARRLAVSQEE
jgi:nicotinamidase/pyrazinamidase